MKRKKLLIKAKKLEKERDTLWNQVRQEMKKLNKQIEKVTKETRTIRTIVGY